MTAIPATAPFVSLEDYLEGERHSDVRHEYVGGTVVAMAGESAPHNLVSGAIYARLRSSLRGGPCQVFINGVKVHVRVGDEDVLYYPDILVACDPQDRHPYYRQHPRVIVEVLSPSTEKQDRVEKYLAYQLIPTLEEYVLVHPDPAQPRATVFRRRNNWRPESLTEGDLRIESIGVTFPLAEVYEGQEAPMRPR